MTEKGKNRQKKTIRPSISIILLLLLLLLTSCTGQGKNPTGEVDPSETEPEWLDAIPRDLKYTGQTLRILSHANGENSFEAEEINSDFVNDAVYWRNKTIEDRFDIDIQVIYPEGDDMYVLRDKVRELVLSDVDEFDICCAYQYSGVRLAQEGLLINLYNQDLLDFSQPWWSQRMIEGMAYRNAAYWCTGDIVLPYTSGMYCVFVNTKLWNDYYPGQDYYQMVLDGEWTLDKMAELCEPVYVDRNRDGERDMEDVYGMITQGFSEQPDGFLYGAGVTFSSRDEVGVPYMNMDMEKIVNTLNKINKLVHENNGTGHFSDIWLGDMARMFGEGKELFYVSYLGLADTPELRNMEDDFAILPMPKYDKEQENYITILHDGTLLLGIPTTNTRLEMTTAVLEAMAAESYRSITPIYYEQALKIKYVRDEKSAQMIDLIRSTIADDFAYYYHIGSEVQGSTSIAYHMRGIVWRGDKHVNSQVRMLKNRWEKDMENLLAEMEKYASY